MSQLLSLPPTLQPEHSQYADHHSKKLQLAADLVMPLMASLQSSHQLHYN